MQQDAQPRVTDGVFFLRPAPLPRGRHELSRADVSGAHRERLMIAATELMSAQGPAAVGVREICGRAATSRTAFYECFTDKEACFSSAYERFIDVLITRLGARASGASTWNGHVEQLALGYLETLAADTVTARAFLVEMDGVGADARKRRRESLRRVALFIRKAHMSYTDQPEHVAPLEEYLGMIYAVRQLACDRLDTDGDPDLLALAPKLATWFEHLWPVASVDGLRKP